MPNKCTNCGKIHPDDADYLLRGCDSCGSKFFFFFRDELMKTVEEDMEKLSGEEMKEIEQDIREIVHDTSEGEETVILDVEAIRVLKPGKYKIDVTNLFTQKPLVVRLGPGKYELDLSVLMTQLKRKIVK